MSAKLARITLVLLVTAWPLGAQQDTSAAGRTGEGVTPPAAGQVGAADTAGLTARQGTERDTAAAGGEMDTMGDEGGAMPRTASALPVLVLIGAALAAFGLALRLAFDRRS